GGFGAWVFTRSGSTWTQQGEELAAGSGGLFGADVALSGDGNTALIGAPLEALAGAAFVFTRSASTWTLGEELTGVGESGRGEFGGAVALSGAGDAALIGAHLDDGSAGAAWSFARAGSTWMQQGSKLTGGGEVDSAEFGDSVALSA